MIYFNRLISNGEKRVGFSDLDQLFSSSERLEEQKEWIVIISDLKGKGISYFNVRPPDTHEKRLGSDVGNLAKLVLLAPEEQLRVLSREKKENWVKQLKKLEREREKSFLEERGLEWNSPRLTVVKAIERLRKIAVWQAYEKKNQLPSVSEIISAFEEAGAESVFKGYQNRLRFDWNDKNCVIKIISLGKNENQDLSRPFVSAYPSLGKIVNCFALQKESLRDLDPEKLAFLKECINVWKDKLKKGRRSCISPSSPFAVGSLKNYLYPESKALEDLLRIVDEIK